MLPHRSGTVATWSVGLLVLAGGAMSSLLRFCLGELVGTAYGSGLLSRTAAAAGLPGLAVPDG